MLKNLRVHGAVNYVRICHLEALELHLIIFGRSLILLRNVVYVVALLVPLGSHQMVNGSMLSVLR